MTIEWGVYYGQEALMTAMFVAMPLLGTGLVIGILISVIQAVTSIQEMTLVFIPKIIGTGIMAGVMGGWMMQQLVSFGTNMLLSINTVGQ